MESNHPPTAQAQLEALAHSRELAVERLFLPRRYVLGWAVLLNACMLPVVLPIYLSDTWVFLFQTLFLCAGIALLAHQRKHHPVVKRPMLRLPMGWVVSASCSVGLGAALAVGIYANLHDSELLGVVALSINFAAYLVAYGGLGFLYRRRLSRVS